MKPHRFILFLAAGLGASFFGAKALARPITSGIVSVGGPTLQPPSDVKGLARHYITVLDNSVYGGFFANNGIINHNDIMAIFQIESAFDPFAFNLDDGGQGDSAYGMGQMLRSTAADMGFNDPEALFNVDVSVEATLKYMRWMYNFLLPRLGGTITARQWVGAYNIGIGNVIDGNLPAGYLTRHLAAKLTIGF